MSVDAGSTVPRRQLGRHLRQLREEAQITVRAAAAALEWSTPKIWRIEGGAIAMRTLDVEAMCRVYGASAELTGALTGLARETRARGWWHSYGDVIPSWFELYVGLEAAASHLRQYDPELVPGLLQTPEYATEILRLGGGSVDEIERAVSARLSRQNLLTRLAPPAPRLEFVLSEAVLRRPAGTVDTTVAQMHRLTELSRLANVSIRVLPFAAGPHPGLTCGAFSLLDFPRQGVRTEPSIVYSESLTGALYLDKRAELATYNRVWSGLDSVALAEPQSRKLIATAVKEYS